MDDAPSQGESGNDFSALIPDAPYADLKKHKKRKRGKYATNVIISLIGRRPIGEAKKN